MIKLQLLGATGKISRPGDKPLEIYALLLNGVKKIDQDDPKYSRTSVIRTNWDQQYFG